MTFDPFEIEIDTTAVTPDTVPDDHPPAPDLQPTVIFNIDDYQPGTIFVFDLEAVVDESRHPRPDEVKVEERNIDYEQVMSGKIDDVKSEIEKGITEIQAEEMLLVERQKKKPIKGKIDALTKVIESGNAEWDAWKKLAADPWSAKICAMGWGFVGSDQIYTMTATNDAEERAILMQFWELQATMKRCGYNIHHYDDVLIAVRSLRLSVTPSRPLDRRKFGNDQAIDLQVQLFPGGQAKKCKSVAYAFGIHPPAGNTSGADVFQMMEDGDLARVRDYVASDVYVEKEILVRGRTMFTF